MDFKPQKAKASLWWGSGAEEENQASKANQAEPRSPHTSQSPPEQAMAKGAAAESPGAKGKNPAGKRKARDAGAASEALVPRDQRENGVGGANAAHGRTHDVLTNGRSSPRNGKASCEPSRDKTGKSGAAVSGARPKDGGRPPKAARGVRSGAGGGGGDGDAEMRDAADDVPEQATSNGISHAPPGQAPGGRDPKGAGAQRRGSAKSGKGENVKDGGDSVDAKPAKTKRAKIGGDEKADGPAAVLLDEPAQSHKATEREKAKGKKGSKAARGDGNALNGHVPKQEANGAGASPDGQAIGSDGPEQGGADVALGKGKAKRRRGGEQGEAKASSKKRRGAASKGQEEEKELEVEEEVKETGKAGKAKAAAKVGSRRAAAQNVQYADRSVYRDSADDRVEITGPALAESEQEALEKVAPNCERTGLR